MYAFHNLQQLPDVSRFLTRLNGLAEAANPELRGLFVPNKPLWFARAPGRLDLMGGIADYSGALVLELPIREATFAALQATEDGMLQVASHPLTDTMDAASTGCSNAETLYFRMPTQDLFEHGQLCTYQSLQRYFKRQPEGRWAAYVLGNLAVLLHEENLELPAGFGLRVLISSAVPEGKGVSSSAALEIATMMALCGLFGLQLDGPRLAILGQKTENLVVGAPCGVMDQMTSACGLQDSLLNLLCQPAEILGHSRLPEGVAVWGLDSGIRHSVAGADYGSVRIGAFMGYRLLAQMRGLNTQTCSPLRFEDPQWQGYLANCSPALFESAYRDSLPITLSGASFLDRYESITDPVTRVDPLRIYSIRQPTAHPIYEHFRVRCFAQLLKAPRTEENLQLLGELMYQSHASYSACGLGSDGTDTIVDLVKAAGPEQGLYGAKITGGGSGGTVAILGKADALDVVKRIAEHYAGQTGREPYLFSGSSPGALHFGAHRLIPG